MKALSNLFAPMAAKIAGGIILALATFATVQTVRLAWAQTELADSERESAEALARAIKRALEAERAAQAAHDKREVIREVHTNTIREVARKADNANPEAAGRSCGPVTSSVLGELRTAAAGQQPPAD